MKVVHLSEEEYYQYRHFISILRKIVFIAEQNDYETILMSKISALLWHEEAEILELKEMFPIYDEDDLLHWLDVAEKEHHKML